MSAARGPSSRVRRLRQAAGKIHSDIERGFIRAETINFSEMIACGSVAAAKEKGLLRSEGKGLCGEGRRHDLLPLQCLSSQNGGDAISPFPVILLVNLYKISG